MKLFVLFNSIIKFVLRHDLQTTLFEVYSFLIREDCEIEGENAETEEDGINADDDPSDQPEQDLGQGVFRVRNADDVDQLMEDNPFLVYSSQLFTLANTTVPMTCSVVGCTMDASKRLETDLIKIPIYYK